MQRLFDRLRHRARSLFRGSKADASLRHEIELHLREQIDENVAAGMSPAEARAEAIRSFGPVAAIEEQCRDTRRTAWVESLAQDLRYAARSLTHQPMLVGVATLSTSVAIAVNTTVFGLAHELLFADATLDRPHEIVQIRINDSSHVPHRRWRDLRDSAALEGLVGFNFERTVNWKGPDQSVSIVPLLVTANFFDVLGVSMAQGRAFTESEARADLNPSVVVVTHGFWRNRLGGRPDVIGSAITINGQDYAVLGVLPHGIRTIVGFGLAPEVYLPLSPALDAKLDDPSGGWVQLVGRLRHDQSVDQGRAAFTAAAQQLANVYQDREFGAVTQFARVSTWAQAGDFATIASFFSLLLVAVGLLLAVACANVAGLLLSRATVRRHEIALRVALGASRLRLVQQLLVEGFCLAVLGTAGGLFVMQLLIRLISRIALPIPMPVSLDVGISGTLLAYAVGLTLLTTVLCALAPALQATRPSLTSAIGRIAVRRHRSWTLRRLLVAGQFAVALVLLLTAALFLRDLTRARGGNPGFNVSHVLVATVALVEGRYTAETGTALLESAVERVRALPGVTSASFAYGAPLTVRHGMTIGTEIGIVSENRAVQAHYHVNFVSPGYFDTMGIPLLAGRAFGDLDRKASPRAVIVNDHFARRYFPASTALGQLLQLPGEKGGSERAEIVGIAADSKYRTLGEEPLAAIYWPYARRAGEPRFAHVFARTAGEPETLRRSAGRALAEIDPIAAFNVQSMRTTLAFAFMPTEVGASLLGALGILGLILALIGMFAMMSYSVSRRTQELGIRIALGASRGAIMRLVFAEAGALAAAGIVVGLGAAWFLAKPLAMFLVSGLRPTDPWSFAGSAALVAVVTLGAAWIPARRAMRIDPITALRTE